MRSLGSNGRWSALDRRSVHEVWTLALHSSWRLGRSTRSGGTRAEDRLRRRRLLRAREGRGAGLERRARPVEGGRRRVDPVAGSIDADRRRGSLALRLASLGSLGLSLHLQHRLASEVVEELGRVGSGEGGGTRRDGSLAHPSGQRLRGEQVCCESRCRAARRRGRRRRRDDRCQGPGAAIPHRELSKTG